MRLSYFQMIMQIFFAKKFPRLKMYFEDGNKAAYTTYGARMIPTNQPMDLPINGNMDFMNHVV